MRRGMLVASAITAILGAHAGLGGGQPGPMTLMVAVALVSLACRIPMRGVPWRRSGLLRLGALSLLLQVALHFGMAVAPWAFGMGIDAHDAASLRASLMAHVVAGASLAVLCWLGERVIDALVILARRVGRRLSGGLRGGAGTAWVRLRDTTRTPAKSALGRPISRGPPPVFG